MKKKRITFVLLIVILVLVFYIRLSTKYVNQDTYRDIAWNYSKEDKTVFESSGNKVELVKLDAKRILFLSNEKDLDYYIRFTNRKLLILNGGYAVKVTMKTTRNSLFGPKVVYINPFTKQVIGSDLRL